MFKKTFTAAAVSATALAGSAAHAANIDLGFIMDMSNSVADADFEAAMDALGDALAANIPVGQSDVYTIAVVSFNGSASTVAAATTINTQDDLDDFVALVKAPSSTSGATNYEAAFDQLGSLFGTLGDKSLINMMTDGEPNEPGSNANALAKAKEAATDLQNAGWDSLSFESVCDSLDCTSQLNLLAGLGFGPGGNTPNDGTLLPIYTSAAQISDPLTVPFVLDLPNFAEYNKVIDDKVDRIVNPGEIPLPAALPLLGGGVLLLGFVGRRRKKAA